MSDDVWIVVPNWERFQHYRDRDPVWIKLYLELRSRDDWRRLTLAERGLLVSIWIEYAASGGTLRASDLASRVSAVNVSRSLGSLSDAGLVRFSASKPLALARSREKRREEKNDRAHAQRPKPAPTSAEPRANAGAYQRPEPPIQVDVDDAMLQLARGWLSP